VFVRDTSGSVDDDICAAYTAMIDACLAELGCEAIVLDCDTDIEAEYRLSPGMPCPLRAEGGGGTDFAPPFARCQTLLDAGERIAGLVYLTDLEGSFPDDPGIPTLWIATGGQRSAPFGRVVAV
jgi:predicted metal-dependent peptidase